MSASILGLGVFTWQRLRNWPVVPYGGQLLQGEIVFNLLASKVVLFLRWQVAWFQTSQIAKQGSCYFSVSFPESNREARRVQV